MEEAKGEQPLLERKKYYENCPGCKVDKAKELSAGQGVSYTKLFVLWMVALSAGIRNSHYSEFFNFCMSFVLVFFCLVETLGVLESLVLLIPEMQLIIHEREKDELSSRSWFEEEQCVWNCVEK